MTTSALTHPQAATSKSYLQLCVDDLDPHLASSWQWKSTLWQTAAVATHVAFTVLSIGSICAAAVYAPIALPILAVSSFLLLKLVNKAHDLLERWSKQASARAYQLKEISRHHQELASVTPEQMQQILLQKGIPWMMIPGMLQNPAHLTTLKPLLAREAFWEGYVQKQVRKKLLKLAKAEGLSLESYDKNKKEIYNLRCEALEIEKRALEGRLKRAFIHAVIHRPTYVGMLNDLGSFSEVSGQERAVGTAASAPSINQLFTFKNGLAPTITVDEVKQATISDLAMRILSAMPAHQNT